MPRALSAEMIRAVNGRETSELFVVLLTISHPSIDPPIRVVSNTEDVVSRGETFIGFPFDITLPDDVQQASHATLKLQNVDTRIGRAIDAIEDPASLTIEVIRWSAPDVVEISYPNFMLRNVQGDVMEITGEIGLDDYSMEPWPYLRATKARVPGAFKFRS